MENWYLAPIFSERPLADDVAGGAVSAYQHLLPRAPRQRAADPVALALWAKCGRAAEAKLERGMIEPENRLTLEEWTDGDTIWLVDLIAPFADEQNKHREILIADIISGPLAGKAFKFHQTDPATGRRSVRTVEADAGEKLKKAIEAAVGGK